MVTPTLLIFTQGRALSTHTCSEPHALHLKVEPPGLLEVRPPSIYYASLSGGAPQTRTGRAMHHDLAGLASITLGAGDKPVPTISTTVNCCKQLATSIQHPLSTVPKARVTRFHCTVLFEQCNGAKNGSC